MMGPGPPAVKPDAAGSRWTRAVEAAGGTLAEAGERGDQGRRRAMDDETAVASVTGVAEVFDLHALKAFAPDKRVRKMLFKSDQLWSEIACYEPGQSTVMHQHPKEEEAIFVLEGTANMRSTGRRSWCPRARSSSSPTRCCTTCATWERSAA